MPREPRGPKKPRSIRASEIPVYAPPTPLGNEDKTLEIAKPRMDNMAAADRALLDSDSQPSLSDVTGDFPIDAAESHDPAYRAAQADLIAETEALYSIPEDPAAGEIALAALSVEEIAKREPKRRLFRILEAAFEDDKTAREAARASLIGEIISLKGKELRVLEVIGSGGSGVVCKVEDQKDGSTSALKLSAPYEHDIANYPDDRITHANDHHINTGRRLIGEIAALHRLTRRDGIPMVRHGGSPPFPILLDAQFVRHPDRKETKNSTAIAVAQLELIDGQDVHALTHRENLLRLDEVKALHIFSQLFDAIQLANTQGVLHSDLKPNNIKLTPEGDVIILDFGSAAISQDVTDPVKPHKARWANPTNLNLTLGYAVRGLDNSPSPTREVFSLGRTIQRLLLGQLSNDRKIHQDKSGVHEMENFVALRHELQANRAILPPKLRSVLDLSLLMTELQPSNRIALEQAKEVLQAIISGEQIERRKGKQFE